jgi:LuxR family maltose regulon positive regulatory protein
MDLRTEAGFSRKLTLVSAPAGYGKTTLVVDWILQAGISTVWLTLEDSENDPALFLAYLIAAIQKIKSDFALQIQELSQIPGTPPQVILTTLTNAIANIRQPFFLVLDDYHVIHSSVIHEQISFMIEHQSPQMHLVLLTREDPLLPIPRLRARGEMLEIRQVELCFSFVEAKEFFQHTMKLSLSDGEVRALEQRTEGWIAGLQFAALAVQALVKQELNLENDEEKPALQVDQGVQAFIEHFSGSHRFILDYLVDEVFNQQPFEIQEFLVKTSILERLCASLCDTMTGRTDSQDLIQAMEQANLFVVPLDQQRVWYRYHHLFAELLQNRLRERNDLSMVVLHQSASRWFEVNGYMTEAIRHALAGLDWGKAARLIGQACGGMLERGEILTLNGWFQQLPEQIIQSNAYLCLACAWTLLLSGQVNAAEKLLTQATNLDQPDGHLSGEIAIAYAHLARLRGRTDEAIAWSERALITLPKTNLTSRSILGLNLGLTYWLSGRIGDTEKILREIIPAAQASKNYYVLITAQIYMARSAAARGNLRQAAVAYHSILAQFSKIPVLAFAHYDLSCIYYEWNELEKAEEQGQLGEELARISGNLEFIYSGHIWNSFLLMARGAINESLREATEAAILADHFPPIISQRSFACLGRISLVTGDLTSATHWIEQITEEVDAHPLYRFLGLTRARLQIAQGKKEDAWKMLLNYERAASTGGWGYGLIVTHILQAICAPTHTDTLRYLENALRLAQPEGFKRVFLDEGPQVKQLLQRWRTRVASSFTDFVDTLLAAFPPDQPSPEAPTYHFEGDQKLSLFEPLTEREVEVLHLVAENLSNRQIAERLVLSLGTVKTHVHNIYGKLGVENRARAIVRARELKIC